MMPNQADVLRVGDRMRMSVWLVDMLKANPQTLSVLVRVRAITKNDDGTFMLELENVPDSDLDDVKGTES